MNFEVEETACHQPSLCTVYTAATCRRGGGGGRLVCSAVPPEPSAAGGKSRSGEQEAEKTPRKAAQPVADWQWKRAAMPPRRPSPSPQQQQGVWTSQPRSLPPGGVDSFYPRRQVAQFPGSEAGLDGGFGTDLQSSMLGSQGSLEASLDFPNLGSEFDEAKRSEEGLQQQRQWRQRALRSLRQDLRAGGGGGTSASRGRPAAPSDSDSDSDFSARPAGQGRSGRGGAGQRGEQRAPARPLPISSSRGSGGAKGMAPPGFFLQTLQGRVEHLPGGPCKIVK